MGFPCHSISILVILRTSQCPYAQSRRQQIRIHPCCWSSWPSSFHLEVFLSHWPEWRTGGQTTKAKKYTAPSQEKAKVKVLTPQSAKVKVKVPDPCLLPKYKVTKYKENALLLLYFQSSTLLYSNPACGVIQLNFCLGLNSHSFHQLNNVWGFFQFVSLRRSNLGNPGWNVQGVQS